MKIKITLNKPKQVIQENVQTLLDKGRRIFLYIEHQIHKKKGIHNNKIDIEDIPVQVNVNTAEGIKTIDLLIRVEGGRHKQHVTRNGAYRNFTNMLPIMDKEHKDVSSLYSHQIILYGWDSRNKQELEESFLHEFTHFYTFIKHYYDPESSTKSNESKRKTPSERRQKKLGIKDRNYSQRDLKNSFSVDEREANLIKYLHRLEFHFTHLHIRHMSAFTSLLAENPDFWSYRDEVDNIRRKFGRPTDINNPEIYEKVYAYVFNKLKNCAEILIKKTEGRQSYEEIILNVENIKKRINKWLKKFARKFLEDNKEDLLYMPRDTKAEPRMFLK